MKSGTRIKSTQSVAGKNISTLTSHNGKTLILKQQIFEDLYYVGPGWVYNRPSIYDIDSTKSYWVPSWIEIA